MRTLVSSHFSSLFRRLLVLMLFFLAACRLTPQEAPGYHPENVRTSASGVTATVLSVRHHEQLTDVELQLAWDEAQRHFDWSILQGPVLEDRYGHGGLLESLNRQQAAGTATLTFSDVPLSDPPLTLRFNSLLFQIPVSETMSLDLGNDPSAGQYWRIERQMNVAGYPLRWESVRLEPVLLPGGRNRQALVFDVRTVPGVPAEDGEMLVGVRLGLAGADVPFESEIGPLVLDGQLKPRLVFTRLPSSPLTITVEEVLVVVRGPWETSWMPPGS